MARRIDWYYHRTGWTSCSRAREFLGKTEVTIKETLSANRRKLGREEALELASRAGTIISCKGKKVTRVSSRDRLAEDEILAALLGPTGNLRAPAILCGKKLVIGFSAEVYGELFI